MQRIGPVMQLPRGLLREDVVLCLGEDPGDAWAAAEAAGLPHAAAHRYRGFEAAADDALVLVGPFGSPAVEAVLWELRQTIRRVVLVGTAGATSACTAPPGEPRLLDPVTPAYQAFDAGPEAAYGPSLAARLPRHGAISTDRFYGFSPLALTGYPAEPGLQELFARLDAQDAMVDMEAAAFHHFAGRFCPDAGTAAVKAVANPLDDHGALPEAAAQALETTMREAVRLLP